MIVPSSVSLNRPKRTHFPDWVGSGGSSIMALSDSAPCGVASDRLHPTESKTADSRNPDTSHCIEPPGAHLNRQTARRAGPNHVYAGLHNTGAAEWMLSRSDD